MRRRRQRQLEKTKKEAVVGLLGRIERGFWAGQSSNRLKAILGWASHPIGRAALIIGEGARGRQKRMTWMHQKLAEYVGGDSYLEMKDERFQVGLI